MVQKKAWKRNFKFEFLALPYPIFGFYSVIDFTTILDSSNLFLCIGYGKPKNPKLYQKIYLKIRRH